MCLKKSNILFQITFNNLLKMGFPLEQSTASSNLSCLPATSSEPSLLRSCHLHINYVPPLSSYLVFRLRSNVENIFLEVLDINSIHIFSVQTHFSM